MKTALAAALLVLSTHAAAQVDRVVTVQRGGYGISGLVTHLEEAKSFRRGIALFPGHPGIMRIAEEDGKPRYDMRGNFLVRSRRHWLDADTLVVVVDAPSDEWLFFSQPFRETPRYGSDVAALLDEVSRRYAIEDWTFVGTSEGSISAFHAARMNPKLARRLILTSSLWGPVREREGLSNAKWEELSAPLLWVHHEDDPCRFTSYAEARRYAQKTRSPLVSVRGGGPYRGDACAAFSAHGYAGLEREVVRTMRSWIKTGVVPPDVSAP